MNEYQYRKQLFITPAIEGEDLLLYGIKKFSKEFKITNIKETLSPEGGEWSFLFNGILNRIIIKKDGNNLIFTGDALPEVVESLKKIMKEIKL